MEVGSDKGFECCLGCVWGKGYDFFLCDNNQDEDHRNNIYIAPGGFTFFRTGPHEQYRKEKYMDDSGQENAKTNGKKCEFV